MVENLQIGVLSLNTFYKRRKYIFDAENIEFAAPFSGITLILYINPFSNIFTFSTILET